MDTLLHHYQGAVPIRLDQLLLSLVSETGLTRSQLKIWIEAGRATINGRQINKAGAQVRPGEEVRLLLEPPALPILTPYAHELSILYEDSDLVVLNKPAGLTMHPGAGNRSKTLVNALVAHYGTLSIADPIRPGIVHRLDRDTTGVVVVARNVKAQHALSSQFAERSVERAYRALVFSTPRGNREVRQRDEGTVNAPIGRDQSQKNAMCVDPNGRSAVTHWKVIERMSYAVLLQVKLQTGRTHQIRVHMSSIGSPVIGDKTYGDFSALPQSLKLVQERFGRQALHAYLLGFTHPTNKERMRFEAPIPPDFATLLDTFRGVRP